jgi:hypothetical protein
MGHLSTFLPAPPKSRTGSASVRRLDVAFGVAFMLSFVVGMSFCDVGMSSISWMGVAGTVGICALLFCASRQKLAMLHLSLVLLAIRMAFAILAAAPDTKGLFASWFAVSALLAALILKKTRSASL